MGFFSSIGSGLKSLGKSVKSAASSVTKSVKNAASNAVSSVKSAAKGFRKDILNSTTIGNTIASAAKGAITGFVTGGPTGALAGAATGAVSGVYEGREITRAERKAAREAESYVAEPVDIGSVVSDVVQSVSGSSWKKKFKHDDDDEVVSKVIDRNTGGSVSGADLYLKEHANRIRYDKYTDKLENSSKKGAKNG